MFAGRRRYILIAAIIFTTILFTQWAAPLPHLERETSSPKVEIPPPDESFLWRTITYNYPITSLRPLPTASETRLPPVQANSHTDSFPSQTQDRRQAIKDAFLRCWSSYKKYAWLHDEVTPISGKPRDTFGGWGATLVDSLDTLWIMDLREEFEEAVDAVDQHISFAEMPPGEINVFETTIRFLGGFLAAYDLSGDLRLLSKAREVGDMLCKAFDTPNHLPIARWTPREALDGEEQAASNGALLAEVGSLSMEFTRLSLVTGDPKYYTLVQSISEKLAASQGGTKVPGLWSIVVDASGENFDAGRDYSLGGMSDSAYEYLPKMMALLGQSEGVYQEMSASGLGAASRHLMFRPRTPDNADIVFPGDLHVNTDNETRNLRLRPSSGHLSCFTGGMYALGGQLLSDAEHLKLAEQLTLGCVWAYNATTSGVMPEALHFSACPSLEGCPWDETSWHQDVAADRNLPNGKGVAVAERLPPGVTKVSDSRYILRPEAIESVLVMYRVTGEERWREMGWRMWEAIDNLTRTELANSAVGDVNSEGGDGVMHDSMESFWMGETLKYFYLLYSDPGLVSLDEWVFNTEAHAFRRLR